MFKKSKGFPQLLGIKQSKVRERRLVLFAVLLFVFVVFIAIAFWPHSDVLFKAQMNMAQLYAWNPSCHSAGSNQGKL